MAEERAQSSEFASVDIAVGRWRSALAPHEAARGMLAVQRNVRRLFGDALTLLENGSDASALVLAIASAEEAHKTILIGVVASLPVGKRMKHVWKDFESHMAKGSGTLHTHRIVGEFPPDVLAELDDASTEALARAYDRIRERVLYVECTHGTERWSVPERTVGRDTVVLLMHAIWKSIQRIASPVQILGSIPGNEIAQECGDATRLRELKEYAESAAAAELSREALAEAEAWGDSVRDRLTKFPLPEKPKGAPDG